MFGSSLPPVVCRRFMSYLRYLCLFSHSDVQHILWCIFCFVCLCVVLCAQCCKFLWIVHLWSHLRYSLKFINTHDEFLGQPMTRVSDLFAAQCTFLLFVGIYMYSATISSVWFLFFIKHTCICFGKIRMSWLTFSLI